MTHCLSGLRCSAYYFFFFFNDTATTEIYTLSLHDALPISVHGALHVLGYDHPAGPGRTRSAMRSEEHTSELQSQSNLVCRLLLEKKKKKHMSVNKIRPRRRQTGQVDTPSAELASTTPHTPT